MAGLVDKQEDVHSEARPIYPKEWYSKLASLTPQHSLAWHVGMGNSQAPLNVRTFVTLVFQMPIPQSIPSFIFLLAICIGFRSMRNFYVQSM